MAQKGGGGGGQGGQGPGRAKGGPASSFRALVELHPEPPSPNLKLEEATQLDVHVNLTP